MQPRTRLVAKSTLRSKGKEEEEKKERSFVKYAKKQITIVM